MAGEEIFANMRRCTKCILPETFPGIKIDANGVCNCYLNYEPVKVCGEEELEKVLDRYRGEARQRCFWRMFNYSYEETFSQ